MFGAATPLTAPWVCIKISHWNFCSRSPCYSYRRRRCPCPPAPPPQREYWRERERQEGAPLVVEYGNDVEGSLFVPEDLLGRSRWNLNVRRCVCVREGVGCAPDSLRALGLLRAAPAD